MSDGVASMAPSCLIAFVHCAGLYAVMISAEMTASSAGAAFKSFTPNGFILPIAGVHLVLHLYKTSLSFRAPLSPFNSRKLRTSTIIAPKRR